MPIVDAARPGSQVYPPDPVPDILLGGSLNIMAGAPGVGKTALFAWILTHFHPDSPPGTTLFGHPVQPAAKLGIITVDRSWSQSGKRWFDLAGLSDIAQYCFHDDPTFDRKRLRTKPRRIDILNEFIDHLEPLPFGSIVYVDPLTLFLGGNLLDYDSCFVAAAEMRDIGRKRGITLFGSAHAAKQKADKKTRYDRLQDRILGSTGIIGFTDTAMYLAAPEEMKRRTFTFLWAPHHHKTQEFSLTREDNGLFLPTAEIELATLDDLLLLHIPYAPEFIEVKNLRALTLGDISHGAFYDHLSRLETAGTVLKPDRGQYQRPLPN